MEHSTSMALTPKHYGILAAIVIIVGGGAFYGGMQYQKSQQPAGRGQFAARGGNGTFAFNGNGGAPGAGGQRGQGAGGRGFGGAVIGEIIGADDKSITVKLADGGSKTVYFGDKVQVSKASEGSVADLTAGEQVMVMGTANSDGSVTAQSIRLGDQPFMVRTGGQAGATTSGGAAPQPAR